MKIRYRPAAVTDMQKTCDYIAQVLKNPTAAATLQRKLLQSISLLKDNPFLGASLSGKLDGFPTDIRFVVVCKQMVFYEVHRDFIEIIRILDGRTDYIAQLFG